MSCKQHKERTIMSASQSFFIGVCDKPDRRGRDFIRNSQQVRVSLSPIEECCGSPPLRGAGACRSRPLSIARLMDRLHTPSAPESGESLLQFSSPGGSKRKTLVVAQPDDEEYAQDAVSVHHTESIHMHDHLLRSPNFQRRARCGQMCCC